MSIDTDNIDMSINFGRFEPGVPGAALWCRQLSSIIRIEVSKSLFSRQALTICGLALIPIVLLTVFGLVAHDHDDPSSHNIERARRIYAYLYSGFILGAIVFLGSAIIFTTLFRGEILDRSIHYYLLTPVRREILVLGKYLAGLIAAFGLFGATTIICYLLLYLPFGITRLVVDVSNGIVISQLSAYLGVTLLGCMGYGALFMTTGLMFRNPLLPVAFLAGWEILHFVLPPALKLFSVIHYLKGLLPIPLDQGPFAIMAAPPPVWVSILGIMGLAVVAMVATLLILVRLEVRYTEE
jgi:ABC-type transport system involved in multi-copper enzyme maturation permease subunit